MNFRIPFIIILFIGLFFSACEKDGTEIEVLDNYIFIEQHALTNGEHISGPEPPLLMIDFPTYSYNSDTKVLNGIIDFEINENLDLVFGSGGCLTGAAGGGCGTGLSAVYEIPYVRGNFELLKAEANGTIVALYGEEVISLAAGEEWIMETITMDTMQVNEETSIVKRTKTDKITNFGVLNKADIIPWEW